MTNRKWLFGRSALRRKLIQSVLLMTVPLIGMLLYNNFYAIHVVRGQVADSYSNLLGLYMNQIDSSLNDADAYMNTVGGSGYDLTSWDGPQRTRSIIAPRCICSTSFQAIFYYMIR